MQANFSKSLVFITVIALIVQWICVASICCAVWKGIKHVCLLCWLRFSSRSFMLIDSANIKYYYICLQVHRSVVYVETFHSLGVLNHWFIRQLNVSSADRYYNFYHVLVAFTICYWLCDIALFGMPGWILISRLNVNPPPKFSVFQNWWYFWHLEIWKFQPMKF